MSGTKKYFWLKLKRDFFKRHDIAIIESMPNGKEYVLFYLKLLVESVSHEGALRFSDTIPYNDNMLATITNTNVDIVRSAMKLLIELKMIEVLSDETIFMTEIEKMIGAETYWAEQKRKQRQEIGQSPLKLGQCPANVQNVQPMSNQELEIDKDKELEIEKDTVVKQPPAPSGPTKKDIEVLVEEYRQILGGILPDIKKLTDERTRKAKTILKEYAVEEIVQAFRETAASDFLTGNTPKGWKANWDWIFNKANLAKILEGNYRNNRTGGQGPRPPKGIQALADLMNGGSDFED